MNFFDAYSATIEHALIAASLALSQYVVLRAGVFSLAPAGVAAVGGYTVGILVVNHDWAPVPALIAAAFTSVIVSVLLAALISRLRGIFQGIATLGFVLVIQAIIIEFPDFTGGVIGINGIPKVASAAVLAAWLLVQLMILVALGRSKMLLIFDAIRSDEAAARSQGVNIYLYHVYAFAISGLFAGISGAMLAFNNYSVVPSLFGFQQMITILAGTVLGGMQLIVGPVIGAMIYSILPDVFSALAIYREFFIGAVLIATILFLPDGLVQRRFLRFFVKEATRRRGKGRGPGSPGAIPSEPTEPHGEVAHIGGRSS